MRRFFLILAFITCYNAFSSSLWNTINSAITSVVTTTINSFTPAVTSTIDILNDIQKIIKDPNSAEAIAIKESIRELSELESVLRQVNMDELLSLCREKEQRSSDCNCDRLESSYNNLKGLITMIHGLEEQVHKGTISEEEITSLTSHIEQLRKEAESIIVELEKIFKDFRSDLNKGDAKTKREEMHQRFFNSIKEAKRLAEKYVNNSPKITEPQKPNLLRQVGSNYVAPCSDPFNQVTNTFKPNSVINILFKEDGSPVSSNSETGYCKTAFLDGSSNIRELKPWSFHNKVFGFMLGKEGDSRYITYRSVFIDERVPLLWVPANECNTESCGGQCTACQNSNKTCIEEYKLARINLKDDSKNPIVFQYQVDKDKQPTVEPIKLERIYDGLFHARMQLVSQILDRDQLFPRGQLSSTSSPQPSSSHSVDPN